MLDSKELKDFLTTEFRESEFFLVDVVVKPGNLIKVYVDKPEGITIQECYEVSRLITGKFDRDVEDYSLDVSSPGLDMPLLVKEQYEKNLGREISIEMLEGKKRKGILKEFTADSLSIEETKKAAVKGKKNKQKTPELITIKIDDIKAVKVIISFK